MSDGPMSWDPMADTLAPVRAARAALEDAKAALRAAVVTAHADRSASVDAIAEAAGLRTRQTVYTWAKEAAPMRYETVTADCTVGRLEDIVRQTWPTRGVPRIGQGRFATVTIPAGDVAVLGAQLDARGITWGLA